MHDAQSPITPVSPAVRAAQKKLRGAKGGKKAKAKNKAPCGGQVIGEATVVGQAEHKAGQEGGKESTEGQQEQQEQQEGGDSFVEATQTRSPVKTAPSLLETRRETSTEKITVETVVVGRKDEVPENGEGKAEIAPFVQKKPIAHSSALAVKPTSTKRTTITTATSNTAVGRAASNPTNPGTAAAKPTAKPRASSSLAAAAAKRRSSIFVPTKSTKPPTRSTFTLPGEAVAAKLKEQRLQREERMRLQGERDEKSVKNQKEIRKKPMGGKEGKGVRVSNVAVVKVPTVKGSAVLSSTARPSAVKKMTTTTIITTTTGNNEEEKAKAARESLMAKPAKRESAAGEQPKKDGNSMKDLAQARAEAAVRGRQASREWAEKKRAREQEMAKTKAA